MKRKSFVLALAALFCLCALSACGGKEEDTPPVVTYRYEIALGTENGIEDRFENGYVTLPAVKVTKLTDGIETETLAYNGETVMDENDYLRCENGVLYIKDSSVWEFSTTVTLRIGRNTIDSGTGDTVVSFPVKKLHIPATAIVIFAENPLIYNQSVYLTGVLTPGNASYHDAEYALVYVVKNGQKLTEGLDAYAEITSDGRWGMLQLAENALNVGDKIGVQAKSVRDGVLSNILEIPVTKKAVESVRVTFNYSSGTNNRFEFDYTTSKAPASVFVAIEPYNATFRDYEITIVNPEECPFASFVRDETGTRLVIDEETFVAYRTLLFYVTADGVKSAQYSVLIK